MYRRGGRYVPAVSGHSHGVAANAWRRQFTAGTYSSTPVTFAAWVQRNGPGTTVTSLIELGLSASANHYQALAHGSTTYAASSRTTTVVSSQSSNFFGRTTANQRGGWDFVAAVIETARRQVWYSGRWIGAANTSSRTPDPPDALSLHGTTSDTPSAASIGLLWPAVWNRALSPGELEMLWNGGCPLDIPGSLISFVPDQSTMYDWAASSYFTKIGTGRFSVGMFAPPPQLRMPEPRLYFPVGGFGGGFGALTGTSAATFGSAATLTGIGALAGTSASTFSTSTSFLSGLAPLAGTTSATFTPAGTLAGIGALAGTAATVFGSAATLTGTGALSGTSAATFGSAATLTGTGALSGASAAAFTAAGTLSSGASGDMVGTASFAFSSAATLTGIGALTGTVSVSVSPAATLSGIGTLAGASDAAFSAAGTLTNGVTIGPLAGSAAVTFDAYGVLTGTGALEGSADARFTLLAVFEGAVPVTTEQPAGRRRRHRRQYVIEIDGQDHVVESAEHAQALLDRVREQVRAKAEVVVAQAVAVPTAKFPPPPRVTGGPAEVRAEVRRVLREEWDAAETRMLLQLTELREQRDRDDEEAIILLTL